MDEKLLRLLKKIIVDVSNTPNGEKLVSLLYKKQNVNEFEIAKKLGGTINQTRNILYRLADKGLVEFMRKKDKKKGGWYIYFWTLKTKRILQMQRDIMLNDIKSMEEQLKLRENERYFHCPNCDAEYDEETAMLNEFVCPECGEVLQLKNNTDQVEKIKKEIEHQKELIKQFDAEILIIEAEEQKTNQRKIAAELRKKKIERAKNKIIRDKEKGIMNKKQKPKKSVKKKPIKKAKKQAKKKKKKK